jgi:arginine/lysine/ornithine decarboxylase
MPGHKGFDMPGNPISGLFPFDITEIRGADFLLSAKGIIRESEENAARLFGTHKTVYSTEGSTLCVKTMLAMACAEKGGFGGKVIATRKAHRSFSDAALLLGLKTVWADTFTDIEKALDDPDVKCVYVTSPDYFGRFEDIKSLADMVHTHGRLLLADNAHGAYLKFMYGDNHPTGAEQNLTNSDPIAAAEQNLTNSETGHSITTAEQNLANTETGHFHPITGGADLVCDSAHKTLPVLTGGAYLHICNPRFSESYKEVMKIFASTSPSYLILASLDYANLYLSDERNLKRMNDVARKIKCIKEKYGINTPEPYKIAVRTAAHAGELCDRYGVEPEYVSEDVLLFMFSGSNSDADIEAADRVLSEVKLRSGVNAKNEREVLGGLGYSPEQ